MLAKKLFSQSAIYGLASILVNGSGFLLLPIYTRSLSPQDYGIISSIGIVSLTFTYFIGFGLSAAVNRFYFEEEYKEKWNQFFGTVSLFLIITGLILTVTLNFAGSWFLDHIFKSVRFDPYIKYGLWIGYAAAYSTIPLALFQVQGKALRYRVLTTASFLALTALMILIVVIQKQGAIGALKAQLYAGLLMGIVYCFYMLKNGDLRINPSHLRVALVFGFPIMIYMITGVFIELSSKYFIEKLATLSDLGIYNLAQQYSSAMTLIISAVNMAWVPLFYERAKNNPTDDVFRHFGTFFITAVIMLGFILSLFSKDILSLIASKGFQNSYTIVPIIILAYIFGNGFWILIINPLGFARKTTYLPLLTILSGCVSIILNILLIPIFGIYGAAWSLLISYVILTVSGLILAHRFFPVRYNYVKISAVLLIAVILFFVTLLFDTFDFKYVFIIKMLIVFIYAGSLLLFRIFTLEEIKSRIKNILKR